MTRRRKEHEVELVPSSPEDIPFFVEMENENGSKEFLNPDSAEKHVAEMAKDEIVYLNIIRNGALKGFFILVKEENGSLEFRRIVVNDKGKGIGQKAILKMEKFAAEEFETVRIWLDVFEHNKRGIHIYKKLGYKEFKDQEHPKGKLIFMEKFLKQPRI